MDDILRYTYKTGSILISDKTYKNTSNRKDIIRRDNRRARPRSDGVCHDWTMVPSIRDTPAQSAYRRAIYNDRVARRQKGQMVL